MCFRVQLRAELVEARDVCGEPSARRIGRVRARRVRKLVVERLAVLHAPSEKLRPRRYGGERVGAVAQQPPERRVVPAKLVTGAVTVRADAGAQAPHLGRQLLARHRLEVVVHRSSHAEERNYKR